MNIIYEITLDQQTYTEFLKNIDWLCDFSYTALFKINENGVYISCTDVESFASTEMRFVHNVDKTMMKIYETRHSQKIDIISLRDLLKNITSDTKIKLFAEHKYPKIMKIEANKKVYCVESTERHARVYVKMSVRLFKQKSNDYFQLKINNGEFMKLINQLCIFSGDNGNSVKVSCSKHGKQSVITFLASDKNNIEGEISICCQQKNKVLESSIKKNTDNDSFILIESKCDEDNNVITTEFGASYMKRVQKAFSNQDDFTILYISHLGILIELPIKKHMNAFIFVKNLSIEDLDSYY